ncbi:MAG: glycosyltransferase [Armatimonadota bacterium]
MKIAMWTSSEERCGIASYTACLAGELRQLGVEVELVPVPYTDRDPGRMEERLARLNAADLVHLQHEYTFFGGIAPRVSSLPNYLARLRRPHVVTAHTVFTAAELLRVETEHRPRQRIAKRILSALPPYRASVERDPFARADAVIVHTAAARERMLQRGIPADRVHVLPAGVPHPDEAAMEPERVSAFRQRLGLNGARVATIFGFVHQDKGYEIALAALKGLPAGVKLVIAGGTRVEHERGYMEQLQQRIRDEGLAERVVITGYLSEPEVSTVMALTDVVLVPHTAANGSYSVMIGLSHGKPVLASDLPCFREIHERGGGAELFDPGDERALAERLGYLLASHSARTQLGKKAAAFAQEQSWSAVAERTRQIYEQVLRGT